MCEEQRALDVAALVAHDPDVALGCDRRRDGLEEEQAVEDAHDVGVVLVEQSAHGAV